jgi:large subunit ribosomal protein L21
MYAIVEIAGRQFRAEVGKKIYVNRLEANEGDTITLDKVLLTDNDGVISVGTPTLGTTIKAKIVAHLKDDKVLIFKKKRRKGYQKLNGHRQYLTQIQIEAIA